MSSYDHTTWAFPHGFMYSNSMYVGPYQRLQRGHPTSVLIRVYPQSVYRISVIHTGLTIKTL